MGFQVLPELPSQGVGLPLPLAATSLLLIVLDLTISVIARGPHVFSWLQLRE